MQFEKLTPAMRQYVEMKQQNPDCILLFRIGDFYEVFFEDAKICANVLDLVITSKNKNSENPIPMAGIPHHSVDKYIPRLISKGYKVAIAEQTTDPLPGRIVERSIKSIITPGTYIQEQQKELSILLAIMRDMSKGAEVYHIAWGDFSLGEYSTKSFDDLGKLQKYILTLRPTEIILDTDIPDKDQFISPLQHYLQCLVSVYALPSNPNEILKNICKVEQLSSFGKAMTDGRASALALLFSYIQHTQQQALTNIAKIKYHSEEGLVLMDEVTIKNLELFSSSYEQSTKYSLFGILDTTKTAGGSRYLRALLSTPINDKSLLETRLAAIEHFLESNETLRIHQFLSTFFDIPKLVSLILYRKLNYVPFVKLRSVLRSCLEGLNGRVIQELEYFGLLPTQKSALHSLFEQLETILKADAELLGDEDYIRDGADAEIDQLRKMAYHSDELLLQYQQELSQASGISNIKLKFIMNQGYFLELTSKDSEAFEAFLEWLAPLSDQEQEKFWISRRQTLKGNQRYSSAYLDSIQSAILSAREQLKTKQQQLLVELKHTIEQAVPLLADLAERIAQIDVYSSYAIFAQEHNFTKPQLTNHWAITIQWGRHPVIEAFLPKDQPFIPNDLRIGQSKEKSPSHGLIHIITWPNMGGKSTYLRQSALIVLLAHCGLYVPAQKAEIWLVDGIFARVGSGDIIAKNQSTFMTEMIEVANILHNASSKSFIIFDELGRGTSTYDGLALTKAILHYILHTLQAKTLIATHYHELIQMEAESKLIKNFSVSVYETSKEVVFMKKISAGGANKSYGIDVAKLAGLPASILQEARGFLTHLEKGGQKADFPTRNQLSEWLFPLAVEEFKAKAHYEKVKTLLAGMDLNAITPLQALQILMKIKDEL